MSTSEELREELVDLEKCRKILTWNINRIKAKLEWNKSMADAIREQIKRNARLAKPGRMRA